MKRLTSENLPQPVFRYSPMIQTGPWYQMAGQVGLAGDGKSIVDGGPEAETRAILANLRKALPDFGLGLEHLVHTNIYTTQFGDFPLINKAWEEVFTADVPPPCRAAVGVAALPLNATVEMEFRLYKE